MLHYIHLFIYPPIHNLSVPYLAIMNNAEVNMEMQISLEM